MTKFHVKSDGKWVCNVFADRMELDTLGNGCRYAYIGTSVVAGFGSQKIGVQIFTGDEYAGDFTELTDEALKAVA